MFWQNFTKLCEVNGKSPSRVTAELGLATGTATNWKKGAIPQNRILKRIADYFGVPVEELTQDESKRTQTQSPGNDSQMDETQLLTYFRRFNREGRGRMLDFAESMERSGKYAAGANSFAQ